MEVISITNEQRDKLCDELARLTFEIKKDKNVKCIYFAPYKGLNSIEGNVLEVTIVRTSETSALINTDEYKKIDCLKEFGLKIIIDLDDISNYTIMDLNNSECRRSNNLMNSVILYDESGEFTRIKEQTADFVKDNDKNLAEIFPPLDETLNKALDNERLKRDTSAVKEFTRSKLFRQLKDF